MSIGMLEHINLTVKDPKKTAANLIDLFGWHIRWEGASMDNGYTVHVGTDTQYLALYATGNPRESKEENYKTINGLNHIAIVVEDLDALKKAVMSAGFKPYNFGHYEPGHRFYFNDQDGIEFEVVSYNDQQTPFYEDYIAK
ncbi:MAG: VOC family protein [Hyphomonadaceae bacterium]|nr:VOC family protein [Hyphomonadaceae bacterium]